MVISGFSDVFGFVVGCGVDPRSFVTPAALSGHSSIINEAIESSKGL